jgi:hypothetical protein
MTAHDFLTVKMWAVTDRPYSAEMLRMAFLCKAKQVPEFPYENS